MHRQRPSSRKSIHRTSSETLYCMEYKDPAMGMPPTGSGAFNGTHTKRLLDATPHFASVAPPTQASSPLRPDATRAIPASTSPAGMTTSPTIVATPVAAISPPSNTPTAAAIVPHSGLQNASSGGTDSMKKKRGRPRKYGPDGTVAIVIRPFPPPSLSPLSPLQKRGRGRPPGSGKNQQLAALGDLMCGSAGAGFTPHTVMVAAGEDVAAKIMSLSQQGPRGICILSANGTISNVTLRQPSTSGGTVTYEGRFEILSLSGSFLVTNSGGTRSRTGGLSVSLAGPDGRVVGGGVAGMLMAASPVQVVVGSFMCTSKKAHTKPSAKVDKPSASVADMAMTHDNAAAAPELSMNEMGDNKPDQSPPHNQSSGNAASSNDESPQGQMIAVQMGWSGSHGVPEGRCNKDIDISSSGQ